MANQQQDQDIDVTAILYLQSLESAQRERLVVAFEKTRPASNIFVLAKRIAKSLSVEQQAEEENIRRVAEAFASWIPYCQKNPAEIDGLASYLLGLPHAPGEAGTALEPALAGTAISISRDEFKRQIARMLRCETSLGISAKAQELFGREERIFLGGAATADLRPVFMQDVEKPASHALLVHRLRLEFLQDGERRSVTVSMESASLAELRAVLDRSLVKNATLRAQQPAAVLDSE